MATIQAAIATGTQPVDAYYVTQGLAVTRAIGMRGWHVTHVASGMTLEARAFGQRKQARAYQQALLDLPIDWSQDKDALLANTETQIAILNVHNCYR